MNEEFLDSITQHLTEEQKFTVLLVSKCIVRNINHIQRDFDILNDLIGSNNANIIIKDLLLAGDSNDDRVVSYDNGYQLIDLS